MGGVEPERLTERSGKLSAVEPSEEQLAALAALPDDQPVVMINLLAFAGAEGAASYARYASEVQPHLERAGATVRYLGAARQVVIGPGERPWWDTIIVVEYPSIASFLEMIASPEYQAVHAHREAGLERAELIATGWGLQAS
jgi:uncharacterized protein (DUF1330 family)